MLTKSKPQTPENKANSKITIKALAKTLILILLTFCLLIEASIIHFGFTTQPQKADCIIVLGCKVDGSVPTPFLAARLDEALRLYQEGYAEHFIVSGGKGSGEHISEAKCMRDYLVARGINPGIITMEDRSKSTMENIKYSKQKMQGIGAHTAIIVSNRFHLKRISCLAKQQQLSASYSGVFLPRYIFDETYGFLREVLGVIITCL
ncbi:MAG: YdcF family protein [Syntrophomonas sp.]